MRTKIWSTTVADLKKESLPIFIKPVKEKAAKGIVIRSSEDASEYEHLAHDAEILCSEVVNFISEWRCFVRYGKIVGIQFYFGDKGAECKKAEQSKLSEEFSRTHKLMMSKLERKLGISQELEKIIQERHFFKSKRQKELEKVYEMLDGEVKPMNSQVQELSEQIDKVDKEIKALEKQLE